MNKDCATRFDFKFAQGLVEVLYLTIVEPDLDAGGLVDGGHFLQEDVMQGFYGEICVDGERGDRFGGVFVLTHKDVILARQTSLDRLTHFK